MRLFSGEKLKNCRKQGGFSQIKLATLVGCTNSEIWKYEHGVTVPGPERTDALAAALGLNAENLLTGPATEVANTPADPEQVAIDALLALTDEQRKRVIFAVEQIVMRTGNSRTN